MDESKGYRFIPEEDREIDIMDLFWRCVSSWRFIIGAMIICAVLAGGLKYAKNLMTVNAAEAAVTAEMTLGEKEAALREGMTAAELNAAEYLIGLTKDIEAKEEYGRNSIYANLDPYMIYSTQLTYYIELPMLTVSREETAASLMNAYRAALSSDELLMAAADRMGGMDTRYIRELVKLTGTDESTQINTGRSSGTVFTVEIDADTEENAGLIADSIDAAMQDYSARLDSEIAEHELISLDRSSSTLVDTELAELQNTLHKDLYTMKTEADNLLKGFNDLQKAFVQLTEEAAETSEGAVEGTEASVTAAVVSPKAGVAKFALIGLAVGLCLSGMIVVMTYLVDGKIKTEDDLEQGYGLRILGRVHADKDNKRNCIDSLIYSLRNGKDISIDSENTLLFTNIKAACEQDNVNSILITSSGRFTETERAYATTISEELKQSGVDSVIMDNLSSSAETFEQMNRLGVIMMLEERTVSSFKDVEAALKYCDAQDVRVIGTAIF